MAAVILTILKIIGIILLCILGLALLLILIVLLSPIRYEIRANVRDGGADTSLADRTEAFAKATYLLHLVRVRAEWPVPEDGLFSVHLASFRLFPRQKKTETETEHFAESDAVWKTEAEEETQVTEPADTGEPLPADYEEPATGDPEGWEPITDAPETPMPADADGESEENREEDSAEPDAEETPKKKIPLSERISAFSERLRDLAQKPQLAAEKIYYTTSGIYDKISMVRVTLENDIFVRAKQLLFNEARRVVRYLLPRKCRVSLVYGTDDPAKTADVIAKVSMLYPIFEDRVSVTPSFEREALYGTALIKGRVRLVVPLYSFLRVYFSKDVKKTVRRFKKIKEGGRTGGRKEDK